MPFDSDKEFLKLAFERWDAIPTLWGIAGTAAGVAFALLATVASAEWAGWFLVLPIGIVAACFTLGIVMQINAINGQIEAIKSHIDASDDYAKHYKEISGKITTASNEVNWAIGVVIFLCFLVAVFFVRIYAI